MAPCMPPYAFSPENFSSFQDRALDKENINFSDLGKFTKILFLSGCGFEDAVRPVWPPVCRHTHLLIKISSKPLWPVKGQLEHQPALGYEL
jgi:hypothetical protein